MIDSHAHLDHCSRPEADVVADAERAGVRKVLAIGMDGASCRAALAAAEAFPQVHVAVGRHPNSAAGFDEADLAELEALAAHERCVAIGETGLDYHREGAPREDMERAFAAQLDLARRTGKPVVIHTRAAEDDTLATLDGQAQDLDVVMHCFSMPDRLDETLERGWWISFAGNVTYPKSRELAVAAERVPDERLLVETDAPYLAPVPHRGRPNAPALVPLVGEAIAAVKGVPVDEVERVTWDTCSRVFRLPA
jgi:TatD DNase family protein